MSEQYVSESDLRVRQLREALEAAAEFVIDPDEPVASWLVHKNAEMLAEEQLARVRRLKRAARLVREALAATTETAP